jgi:hypothetical protein
MSETMSDVERVLWRIAELGARCSQHSVAGGRGPLWAELEKTIAGLEADFEAARQAVDIAPAQVRSLEGRLNVAQKERDRERARADESVADAEAARRERDRERQRAAKATAAAVAAKATASESVARATAAEAARDQAVRTLDEAVGTRDQAVSALEAAITGHDQTVSALEQAVTTRDQAVRALDEAMGRMAGLEADLETARAERDAALAAQAEASADLSEAVDTLAARAEGAVLVLPGVGLPEAPAGPVAPATRVGWRPTWSEWAGDDRAPAEIVVPEADVADDRADEIVLDEGRLDEEREGGTRRYLNVAATIGQLLPDDLGPLLLSRATVVRREGRLFATVAITTNPWEASGSDGAELAQKLADAGYRVEWTSAAPLAC